MSTVIRQLRLLMLVLLSLSILACKSVSTVPSMPPTAPEVDCKKGASETTPPAPKSDRWIDQYGRISEEAATWMDKILALLGTERALRKGTDDCLDSHEEAGTIRQ